jgi:hypothetical protein
VLRRILRPRPISAKLASRQSSASVPPTDFPESGILSVSQRTSTKLFPSNGPGNLASLHFGHRGLVHIKVGSRCPNFHILLTMVA